MPARASASKLPLGVDDGPDLDLLGAHYERLFAFALDLAVVAALGALTTVVVNGLGAPTVVGIALALVVAFV